MSDGKNESVPSTDTSEDSQAKMERFLAARRNLDAATEAIAGNTALDDGGQRAAEADAEARRGEVSAATIGRMLGLVTASDIKLIESKLDLLQTRVNSALTKLDKLQSSLGSLATGADVERLEVQLSMLRTMLGAQRAEPAPDEGANGTERMRENIVTNRPSGAKFVSRRKD